jgi:hypothetical protein
MQETNGILGFLSAVAGQAHSFLMEWKKTPTLTEYGSYKKRRVNFFGTLSMWTE